MPSEKHELVAGEILSVEVEPEDIQATVTKLMKVISVERRPNQKLAWIEMKLQAGTMFVHIDEATARAMAAIFDD